MNHHLPPSTITYHHYHFWRPHGVVATGREVEDLTMRLSAVQASHGWVVSRSYEFLVVKGLLQTTHFYSLGDQNLSNEVVGD